MGRVFRAPEQCSRGFLLGKIPAEGGFWLFLLIRLVRALPPADNRCLHDIRDAPYGEERAQVPFTRAGRCDQVFQRLYYRLEKTEEHLQGHAHVAVTQGFVNNGPAVRGQTVDAVNPHP